jgi:hypothetical protein
MKKSYEKPKILTDEISVSVLLAGNFSTDYPKCYNPDDPTYPLAQKPCEGCTTGSWCKVEKGLKPATAGMTHPK